MYPYWELSLEDLTHAINTASGQEHGESQGEHRFNPIWDGACHKSSGLKKLGGLSIRETDEGLLLYCFALRP